MPALHWLHSTTETSGKNHAIKEGLLRKKIAEFLIGMKSLDLNEESAWQEATAFIAVIQSRTGILIKFEESYRFVHLTFQEYLAARDIRKRTLFGGEEELWQEIKPRLQNAHWREVLLLLMGSLDDDELPTRLTQRILEQTDKYEEILHRHLYFAARILADRLDIAVNLQNQIVDRLLHLAAQNAQGSFDAMHALCFLTGNERAAMGLIPIALNSEVNADLRKFAAEAIIIIGFPQGGIHILDSLVKDHTLPLYPRLKITERLFELGLTNLLDIVDGIYQELIVPKRANESEAILLAQLLIRLEQPNKAGDLLINYLATVPVEFWDYSFFGHESPEALQILKKSEQSHKVGNLLASIAWDKRADFNKISVALHKLKEWKPDNVHYINQLKELILDEHTDDYLKVCVTEALIDWLDSKNTVLTIMQRIMSDEQIDLLTRAKAAHVLGLMGEAEQASRFLLSLLWHKELDEFDDLDSDVCRYLTELSSYSQLVVPGLKKAASDPNVIAGGRYYAAESLIELQQIEDAQNALFNLLQHEGEEDWVPAYSASALLKIAHFPEAIEVLRSLTSDPNTETWIRAHAASALIEAKQANSIALALVSFARHSIDPNRDEHGIIDMLMELDTGKEVANLFKEWLSAPETKDFVRYKLASNLAKLGYPSDATAIFLQLAIEKSETENVKVRFDSIMQLGNFGETTNFIDDTLIGLASDEDQWVRHASYTSLKTLLGFDIS